MQKIALLLPPRGQTKPPPPHLNPYSTYEDKTHAPCSHGCCDAYYYSLHLYGCPRHRVCQRAWLRDFPLHPQLRTIMDLEPIFCICGVVLLFAVLFYFAKQAEKKTIASIPEEFKYIYVNIYDFIAVDPRNRKILLALEGTREMYDFADIQEYERDTRTIRKRSGKRGTSIETVYYLILHVNDKVSPTWQFSGEKDEMDCATLLVSRALDGTLPDTDERRIFDGFGAEKFKAHLSSRTRTQG